MHETTHTNAYNIHTSAIYWSLTSLMSNANQKCLFDNSMQWRSFALIFEIEMKIWVCAVYSWTGVSLHIRKSIPCFCLIHVTLVTCLSLFILIVSIPFVPCLNHFNVWRLSLPCLNHFNAWRLSLPCLNHRFFVVVFTFIFNCHLEFITRWFRLRLSRRLLQCYFNRLVLFIIFLSLFFRNLSISTDELLEISPKSTRFINDQYNIIHADNQYINREDKLISFRRLETGLSDSIKFSSISMVVPIHHSLCLRRQYCYRVSYFHGIFLLLITGNGCHW